MAEVRHGDSPARALGWEDESEAGWQWWAMATGLVLIWDRLISRESRRERRRQRRCKHQNLQSAMLRTPWEDFHVWRCGDCGRQWDRGEVS